MLWYKVWMETRWRFLVCLALVLLPSYGFLTWRVLLDVDGPAGYLKSLFGSYQIAAVIWLLSAILLGLGGLVREKAVGSSSLTLALPVSRGRLVAVRVGVGVAEAIALAVAPWVSNILTSVFKGTPFSMSQGGCCILLLAGGGMVYLALAVLISSVIEGEYTSLGVALGVVILAFDLSRRVDWLKGLNLIPLVTGNGYINKGTFLFSEALPWSRILASLSVAALMILASIGIIQRREF